MAYFISNDAAYSNKAVIENLIVICVVSNASSIYNNFLLKFDEKILFRQKALMFGRVFIICVGSILYAIILSDDAVTKFDIVINYIHAWIPTIIIILATFIIAFLGMLDGGEL